MPDTPATDLRTVCGSKLPEEGSLIIVSHQGKTHYFCELVCLQDFKNDPIKFLRTHRPDPLSPLSISDIE